MAMKQELAVIRNITKALSIDTGTARAALLEMLFEFGTTNLKPAPRVAFRELISALIVESGGTVPVPATVEDGATENGDS